MSSMDTRDTTAPVTAELGALTHQFLAAVSFEQGERPRYDTIRDLFIGEGLLIKNSSDSPEVSSVDQFIQSRQQVLDSGALTSFREVEIADVTEAFATSRIPSAPTTSAAPWTEASSQHEARSRRSSSGHPTGGGSARWPGMTSDPGWFFPTATADTVRDLEPAAD